MTYTPESMAHWNIGQTVRHLINQGIPASDIRTALIQQAEVLGQREAITRPNEEKT